jgi:hypothetical protein
MEYIKDSDLNAIKNIIDEFEGETVLGKHMFKAIKAYFKQKDSESRVIYTSSIKQPEKSYSSHSTISKLQQMLDDAETVLHKNFLKLTKKGKNNGSKKVAKSKKKANS